MASDALSPTAYTLLGLLSFGRSLTGYELKKWADASLRFFHVSPAMSQIYGELKRLQQRGLIDADEQSMSDDRTRVVYTITHDGMAALSAWVDETDVAPPVLKHSVIMRVWLGHLSTPDRLRSLLESHLVQMAELQYDARTAANSAVDSVASPFPALANTWAAEHYGAEIALAEGLLARLADLEPEAERTNTE